MNTSIANISLSLKPSRVLFISFVFIYALAAVSLVAVSISIWIKVIAIGFVLASSVYTIKHYIFLKNKTSVVKISAASDSRKCRIEINCGKIYQAHIKNAGWIFGYFAIFVLNTNTNKYKTIIAKDVLSQEQFYALRLYLRSINTLR